MAEINEKNSIVLFNDKKVRRVWFKEKEEWFFSVVDVIEILTDSQRSRRYWNDLKTKLKEEGSQLSDFIGQFKMIAEDGKMRETDCLSTKNILRLIQSVPSKKAEPFKLWLAKVGNDRINETADPEIAINRALETYLKKGYTKEWINQRLKTIEVRKELTDEWENRGIKKGLGFAILTDEITKAWSDMTTKQYKEFKNLKKESLRDNMTNLELVLNMLAEATTTKISKKKKPETFVENKLIAKKGGKIAGNTRKEIEETLGEKIISKGNSFDSASQIGGGE
jgi:prophage antirepressor-like protein